MACVRKLLIISIKPGFARGQFSLEESTAQQSFHTVGRCVFPTCADGLSEQSFFAYSQVVDSSKADGPVDYSKDRSPEITIHDPFTPVHRIRYGKEASFSGAVRTECLGEETGK